MEYPEDGASNSEEADRRRGARAEEVAQWYFRLNGFFLIPGFVVHPDAPNATPRTEADLLGIRLKGSAEGVWQRRQGDQFRAGVLPKVMSDHAILTDAGRVGTVARHLVAMVEVKAGRCSINGPWSDQRGFGVADEPTNMERALGRVGFGNRSQVHDAAGAMFKGLRYEGPEFVVQYFAVGRNAAPELQASYPKIVQITFDQIGSFFRDRLSQFPEKIPTNRDIVLWEGFGDAFRWWFEGSSNSGRPPTVSACQAAVGRYLDTGRC